MMEHHTAPPSHPIARPVLATPQSDALRLPALLAEAKRQAVDARRCQHGLAEIAAARLLTLTPERRTRLEPVAGAAIEAARLSADAALAWAQAVHAEIGGSPDAA